MNHLTQTRLLELGLNPTLPLGESEERHLDSCKACASALAEERELSLLVSALPQAEPPADFVATTVERFALTHAEPAWTQTSKALGLVLGLGTALLVAMTWLLSHHAGTFLEGLAQALQFVWVGAGLVHVLAVSIPAVAISALTAATLMVVASGLLLRHLALVTVPENSPAP